MVFMDSPLGLVSAFGQVEQREHNLTWEAGRPLLRTDPVVGSHWELVFKKRKSKQE